MSIIIYYLLLYVDTSRRKETARVGDRQFPLITRVFS